MGPTVISSATPPRAGRLGAELEADDPVHVVAARGQHENRGAVGGAELAQHIEARDARQHHVEDQDLELADLEQSERIAAVVHALDLEMLCAQVLAEHLTKLAIIIHQEHARIACRRPAIRLIDRACHMQHSHVDRSFPPSSSLVNELTILCMQTTQHCVNTRFAAAV